MSADPEWGTEDTVGRKTCGHTALEYLTCEERQTSETSSNPVAWKCQMGQLEKEQFYYFRYKLELEFRTTQKVFLQARSYYYVLCN